MRVSPVTWGPARRPASGSWDQVPTLNPFIITRRIGLSLELRAFGVHPNYCIIFFLIYLFHELCNSLLQWCVLCLHWEFRREWKLWVPGHCHFLECGGYLFLHEMLAGWGRGSDVLWKICRLILIQYKNNIWSHGYDCSKAAWGQSFVMHVLAAWGGKGQPFGI